MDPPRFPPFSISSPQNTQGYNLSQIPNSVVPPNSSQQGNNFSQFNNYPRPGQFNPSQPSLTRPADQNRPNLQDPQFQPNNFRPTGNISQISGPSSGIIPPMQINRSDFTQPGNISSITSLRSRSPYDPQGNSAPYPPQSSGALMPPGRASPVPNMPLNPPFSSSTQPQSSGINPPFSSGPTNSQAPPRFPPFSSSPGNSQFQPFNTPGNSSQGQPLQLPQSQGGSNFNPSQPLFIPNPTLMRPPMQNYTENQQFNSPDSQGQPLQLPQNPGGSNFSQQFNLPNNPGQQFQKPANIGISNFNPSQPAFTQPSTQNYTESQAINQPFKSPPLNLPQVPQFNKPPPFPQSSNLPTNINNPALNKAQNPPIIIPSQKYNSPATWAFSEFGMNKDFSKSENELIDAAFKDKKDHLILESNEGTFLIDFKKMIRRRIANDGEPINRQGGGVSWKWKNEDGTWWDYSPQDNQTIESGYQNYQNGGNPSILLNEKYTINFITLRQANKKTNFGREIKRET